MQSTELKIDTRQLFTILDKVKLNPTEVSPVEAQSAVKFVEELFLQAFPLYGIVEEISREDFLAARVDSDLANYPLFEIMNEVWGLVENKEIVRSDYKWINYLRNNQDN